MPQLLALPFKIYDAKQVVAVSTRDAGGGCADPEQSLHHAHASTCSGRTNPTRAIAYEGIARGVVIPLTEAKPVITVKVSVITVNLVISGNLS